jgi:WD40 repeat protein/serine/threonine protein kinase
MSSSSEKLIVCTCGAEIPFGPEVDSVCPKCAKPLETAPSTVLAPTAADTGEEITEAPKDVHSLEWKIGDVILGRYAVLGQVGEGGMGHVYRVRHLGWHMDLAVKSPKSKILRRKRGVENFERECETWVNLGLHPHIVTCYYVRRVGGIPRVFAEYVPGGSVWEYIQNGKLYEGDPEEVQRRIFDVAIQFAWGLRYAHEQGIVHQDVKPGNVLISTSGLVKVTDFGLARIDLSLTDDADSETQGAKFAGMTRAYCSPEQARSAPLTARSDMWSWATSILEMYCSRVTWKSGDEAPGTLERAARGKYINPNAPRIPEGVIALLRACFMLEVNDRPANMGDVANELKEIYASTFGHPYERPEPRMAEALADSLNNRAVSLLDLGRGEQAHEVWTQALKADPHHPESTFNDGVSQWRDGELADDALRQRLSDVRRFHPGERLPDYLLGQFHLEQGNYVEAKRALRRFRDDETVRPEWREAERMARERRPLTRGFRTDLEGHNDAVTAVTHLIGQRAIVSGSADNTLKRWNTETGECDQTFEGHTNSVTAVCGSGDGRLVFSTSRDRTARCWEVATGRCLKILSGSENDLTCLAVTRSGQRVFAGGQDGALHGWDTTSGTCDLLIEAHRGGVTTVALTHGGKYAFTAGQEGSIKRWDLESGSLVSELAGHDGAINTLALSDDGRILISGGADKSLRMWHAASGTALRTMHGHQSEITSVAVSTDGVHAISGGKDNTVRIWELGHGRCLTTLQGHIKPVRGVSWRRDGRRAASCADDGKIFIWQANHPETPFASTPVICQATSSETILSQGQAFEAHLRAGTNALETGNTLRAAQEIRTAREQPGHQRSPDAIQLWQQLYVLLPRTRLRGLWEDGFITQGDAAIRSIHLTRSGRYALVLSGEKSLKVWDVIERRPVREFDTGTQQIECVTLSPDGYDAVTGGWQMAAWNAQRGDQRKVFESKGEVLNAIALSLDGRWAASAQSKSISIWEMETGRLLQTLTGHTGDVNALAWNPSGETLVSSAADRRVVIWHPHTNMAPKVLDGHEGNITALAMSPDGQRILSGTGSIWARPGELRLWNTRTLKCERVLEGHADSIYSIGWSGDSRYAITGSADRTAVLWDVNTGQRIYTLEGHKDSVFTTCFSADGRFALTGGKDGSLRIWTLDWDLEERQSADWDNGATPFVEQFVALKHAYAAQKRTANRIAPQDELPLLKYQLGCAGYGWLHPEGIANKLKQIDAKGAKLLRKYGTGKRFPGFRRR